jgi:hypothetical protein
VNYADDGRRPSMRVAMLGDPACRMIHHIVHACHSEVLPAERHAVDSCIWFGVTWAVWPPKKYIRKGPPSQSCILED